MKWLIPVLLLAIAPASAGDDCTISTPVIDTVFASDCAELTINADTFTLLPDATIILRAGAPGLDADGVHATATHGENGASLTIKARHVEIHGTIKLGNGGHGGNATAHGPDAVATAGNGGNAGTFTCTCSYDPARIQGGAGGDGGDAYAQGENGTLLKPNGQSVTARGNTSSLHGYNATAIGGQGGIGAIGGDGGDAEAIGGNGKTNPNRKPPRSEDDAKYYRYAQAGKGGWARAIGGHGGDGVVGGSGGEATATGGSGGEGFGMDETTQYIVTLGTGGDGGLAHAEGGNGTFLIGTGGAGGNASATGGKGGLGGTGECELCYGGNGGAGGNGTAIAGHASDAYREVNGVAGNGDAKGGNGGNGGSAWRSGGIGGIGGDSYAKGGDGRDGGNANSTGGNAGENGKPLNPSGEIIWPTLEEEELSASILANQQSAANSSNGRVAKQTPFLSTPALLLSGALILRHRH